MKIHILSDEMASRIAAGEVVERPASVVKELIENSLDAGATEIFVWVEKSGTALDTGDRQRRRDGGGRLELAVERHATSKIKEDEDLFRIATLGFRGEALPSIGSVSRMEIISRSPKLIGSSAARGRGKERGDCFRQRPRSGRPLKSGIFFLTRRRGGNFSKSPATELSHICDVVNRMALAHPSVHFRLQHDGRNVADYAAVKEAKDRLQQVLGREIARGFGAICGEHGELSAQRLSKLRADFVSQRPLSLHFCQSALRARQSAYPCGAPGLRYLADEGTVSSGCVVSRCSFRRCRCQRTSGEI